MLQTAFLVKLLLLTLGRKGLLQLSWGNLETKFPQTEWLKTCFVCTSSISVTKSLLGRSIKFSLNKHRWLNFETGPKYYKAIENLPIRSNSCIFCAFWGTSLLCWNSKFWHLMYRKTRTSFQILPSFKFKILKTNNK